MTNVIPHPIFAAAERRRSGREVPPGASPTLKADSGVRRGAPRAPERRAPLTCACCYAETAPLVQFFNQDRGFGLCSGCADWIERRNGPEYLLAHYGRRGVHIESKEILNGKL